MKCILLMEDSTGKKTAIKIIANSLPDALFTIVAEAAQKDADFLHDECEVCQYRQTNGVCKNPLETFSRNDEELISAWNRTTRKIVEASHG